MQVILNIRPGPFGSGPFAFLSFELFDFSTSSSGISSIVHSWVFNKVYEKVISEKQEKCYL